MMDRRAFLAALSAGLGRVPAEAGAQEAARVYRVGYLSAISPNPVSPAFGFLDFLRELGYVEGRNVRVEARYAEGKLERLPELAGELVRSQIDVLVAPTGATSRRPGGRRARSRS